MSVCADTRWLEPNAKPAASRRHEEADLQHSVLQYLRWALPVGAVINHSPGEGKRSRKAQAALVRSGYQSGWPDIEIVWQSKVYFIELKSRRGSVSKAQRETCRRLIYAGAPVMLCRSVLEVEAQLREACVPLRASVAA